MSEIILAFKVVFPILIYICIGYGFKTTKFYRETSVADINKLVFKLFLPCLLFYNIYSTEISLLSDMRYIVYSAICILITFIILMVFAPLFIKENSKRGVFIQGVFRSNFVLFGLPITLSLLGDGSGGQTSIAIAIVVPLFNVLAVICMEVFRKNKINFLNILKGIIKNPLIISSVLGVIFLVAKIEIPDFCLKIIRDLSRVATPLALIGLGGSFEFASIKSNLKLLIPIVLLKLIVIPVSVIGIGAYVLGFRGAVIVTLISMFASPTAVSSFTMAQAMGGDSDLASQTVVFTSIFSIITVFLIVATTKALGLF